MRRLVTWMMILWIIAVASSVNADEKPNLRALLIGISDDKNSAWIRLPGCRLDVQTVYDFLTDPQGQVQAEPARVRVLPETEATRSGVEAAFDRLVSESQPGDVVYESSVVRDKKVA